MMVERTPYTMGQFVRDLDDATNKLQAVNRQPQAASTQELKDLIKILQQFNKIVDPSSMGEKKFGLEGLNISAKIDQALIAIQLFQRYHPETDRATHRNVDQAITSIYSSLNSALKTFDKNLRDLKKYKIGRRVEKTGEAKQS